MYMQDKTIRMKMGMISLILNFGLLIEIGKDNIRHVLDSREFITALSVFLFTNEKLMINTIFDISCFFFENNLCQGNIPFIVDWKLIISVKIIIDTRSTTFSFKCN